MEAACRSGEHLVVALCLASTRDATLDLLTQTAAQLGTAIAPRVVMCAGAWDRFEAGDMAAYASAIAGAIRADLDHAPQTDAVILAQASMRVAEAELADLGVPILSAPELAAKRVLELAGG